MKIAVVGAGAMGSIYGSHLSSKNEVYLIDKNQAVVDIINAQGLKLQENGTDVICYPKVVSSTSDMEPVDLIILFVKALFSESALEENKGLIGKQTYVMTLQNGSGHENILKQFVSDDHIIIGTTEDNGAVLEPGYVRHGGNGTTNIGMLTDDKTGILDRIKETFDGCGFHVVIHDKIQKLIWDKLFTNASLSAVTGILQVSMGAVVSNPYAWNMTVQLIKEAVAVANAMDLNFDEACIIDQVRRTALRSPDGLTSIYMDIKNGRRTEVDTISGSVVVAAAQIGLTVPGHSFVVNMVHALEQKAV